LQYVLHCYLGLDPDGYIWVHQAAKSDSGSYGAFVGFFECLEGLLGGLVIRAVFNPNLAMTETITKITAELLSILALATKRVNEGRFCMFCLFRNIH